MNRMNRPWTFLAFLGRISIFLTGLSVGAFSLLGALFRGAREGIPAGARHGLKWAAAMIFFFAIANYLSQFRVSKRYGCPKNYNPRQSRTVVVRVPINRALAAIETGLLNLPSVRPDSVIRAGNAIHAVTRVTFRSFAEDISVSCRAEDEEKTLIFVESRPRSWGTMVDYGKGIENVEEVTRSISRWLGTNVQPT